MKEVVISVGMGPGQLVFIKQLTKLGYEVVAFGKGKNSQDAISLCYKTANIDTSNYKEAQEWIDSLGVQVLAVGSYAGGKAVQTVQALSNYYHVATQIPNSLIFNASKEKQQKFLEMHNLSTITTWNSNDITADKIRSCTTNTDFIIKPIIGRGSEGIQIVSSDYLIKLVENKQLAKNKIIQTVVTGTEYRIVVIVQNKKIKLLAPIMRKSYRKTLFLGELSYSDKHLIKIQKFVQSFIDKFCVINSIFKIDVIVSETSINIIEMDIGVGGGMYYKTFVSRLYNMDLLTVYINLILNKPINDFLINKKNLKMEYVFNHRPIPIKYDLDLCKQKLTKQFGDIEILVNLLHPENKGG